MERGNVSDEALGVHFEGDSAEVIRDVMAKRKAVGCGLPPLPMARLCGRVLSSSCCARPVAALVYIYNPKKIDMA
jgi:hypothetical protein